MGLMTNFVLYASLVVIVVASGVEADDADGNEVTVTDGFQLGSQSVETHFDGLTEVAKAVNNTALMEWNVGAPVPPAVESFPGCTCNWEEPGWTCEGSAVYPRLMQGEKCCCCGIHCKRGRRCTDDQCWSIGVDQGDEVRAQEKAWAEMLKNADFALNDELPVKIVDLERGRCTNTGIENACRRYQMTPVCDHTSYVSMKRCYTPGLKGTKFWHRHFSHWTSHRQHFGIPEKIERRLPGTCFMGNNGNWALAPHNNGHAWTNHGGTWTTNSIPYYPKTRNMHANDIDQCKPVDRGGWGCWKTFCVPNEPNYNDPATRR